MYDFLEGRIVGRHPARLVLQVGGVGYELTVPAGAGFPLEGESLRVHTHLVVREDAHVLFGFRTRAERQLFRLMLRVQRVGPALALAIVSGLSPDDLLEALRQKDAARLARIKGVGKKTAERVLLELSDRIEEFVAEEYGAGLAPPSPKRGGTDAVADAVRALVSIGFSEGEAQKSVEAAATQVDAKDLEALLRVALRG